MNPTERWRNRPTAVLRVVNQHLAAVATQIPEPALAEALTYLGALVGYTAREGGRAQRENAHRELVETLCGRAEKLAGEAAVTIPADEPDRATRAVIGLALADAEGIQGAAALLGELLGVLGTIEHGWPGPGTAPDRVGHIGQAGEAAVSPPAAPDVDTLTRYLRRHTGDDGVAVETPRSITGGFSKITTLASYVTGGARHDIALRQVPAGVVDDALAPEYEVLRRVWTPDLPIPRPLWLELGATEVGGPFFASQQGRGATLGTVFGATEPIPESVCLGLADFLARLHATDVSGFETTPVAPMRTGPEVEAAIREEQRDALCSTSEVRGSQARPLLAGIFAWLRANAPRRAGRVALVHGDLGFHNILVADGELTAVLDWERAHLGDPVEDLMYLRPSVEPVFSWELFLERYVEAGGQRPDDARAERFYDVWKDVWRAAQCIRLGADFDAGDTRLPAAIAGCLLAPRFLASAIQAALGPLLPVGDVRQ
jgi:aminoglycoside phosphotransferase (APT) family kinase protein